MGNEFQKFALQHQGDDFNKKDLMEELAATNDVIYPCAKPSDITGQSLAVTMETDKTKVLNSMATNITPMLTPVKLNQPLPLNWMESTTVVELAEQAKEATANDGIQETQETIDEIQEFLDQFTDEDMDQDAVSNLANELLSEGQRANLEAMNVSDCPLANSTFNDDELNAAEDMLDQLVQGTFTSDEIQHLEQPSDSGYTSAQSSINVSNVSEIITEDGQNIIIVIAPSKNDYQQPMTTNAAPSTPNGTNEVLASINVPVSGEVYPQTEMETSEDEGNNSGGDDSDWSPSFESSTSHLQPKSAVTQKKNKPGR